MAYTFSVNQTPGNSALAMYQLIAQLIAAGWTKVSDSDGTTYSAAGTQVTSGAAGANGFNNANAWVHLRAPAVGGFTRSLTIQRGSTTLVYRMKYSCNAGFSGGSPAAGVTPTATDESVIFGAGTDASPTFHSVFATDGTFRFHVVTGGAAEGYSWIAFGLLNTTTTSSICMFMDVIRSGTQLTGDVDPCIIGKSAITTTCLTELQNITTTGTNPRMSDSWLGPTNNIANHVRMAIGTPGSINIHAGNANPGVNPFNNKDVGFPALWVRYAAATSPTGVKGLSTLLMHNSLGRTNLDTLNVAGTRDFIYFMGYQIPWDGSVPTV